MRIPRDLSCWIPVDVTFEGSALRNRKLRRTDLDGGVFSPDAGVGVGVGPGVFDIG